MHNIKELKEDIIKILNKKSIKHESEDNNIITPLCVINVKESRLEITPKNFYCGIFVDINTIHTKSNYNEILEVIEEELRTYQDHEDLKKSAYFT